MNSISVAVQLQMLLPVCFLVFINVFLLLHSLQQLFNIGDHVCISKQLPFLFVCQVTASDLKSFIPGSALILIYLVYFHLWPSLLLLDIFLDCTADF